MPAADAAHYRAAEEAYAQDSERGSVLNRTPRARRTKPENRSKILPDRIGLDY